MVNRLDWRMFVTVFGSALVGIEAHCIHIEVNWLLTGKSSTMVGLPDSAVRESLERIESTFKTNGFRFPRTKLVINLAPADIRKSGTALRRGGGQLGGQSYQPAGANDYGGTGCSGRWPADCYVSTYLPAG